jgi:transposase-like protein
MLNAKRYLSAAKRFFKKMLRAGQRRLPFAISVDKNAAYAEAFISSQDEKILPPDCKLRRVKYLNDVIEQDRRFVKKKSRLRNPSGGFTQRSELSKALKR